jgi:hypothetical protein
MANRINPKIEQAVRERIPGFEPTISQQAMVLRSGYSPEDVIDALDAQIAMLQEKAAEPIASLGVRPDDVPPKAVACCLRLDLPVTQAASSDPAFILKKMNVIDVANIVAAARPHPVDRVSLEVFGRRLEDKGFKYYRARFEGEVPGEHHTAADLRRIMTHHRDNAQGPHD